jgi:A/G-specific adenine glycosylase
MLQQTQVATVIPYYLHFLELFPDLKALADAPESKVLTAWSGLGYYSRAKNLRRGARYLVDKHAGKFPRTRDEILKVPGIGPYTAGAILSIAFNLPEPLVDGNVQRFFARVFGMRESIESGTAKTFFWDQAEKWVKASEEPRVLNQALMELGATICTKGKPRCGNCPLQSSCVAFREGTQEELPVRKERRKPVNLWWVGLILESGGKIFLKKNVPGEWWSDLWDFPHVEVSGPKEVGKKAEEAAALVTGLRSINELDHQKHTVTHHKIHVAPYVFHLKAKRAPTRALDWEGEWFTPDAVKALPLSALARKLLNSCPSLC